MKILYEIRSWHLSEDTDKYGQGGSRLHEKVSFEGDSVEECDEKALNRLGNERAKPANCFTHLTLDRIDVPEKRTRIEPDKSRDAKCPAPNPIVPTIPNS